MMLMMPVALAKALVLVDLLVLVACVVYMWRWYR